MPFMVLRPSVKSVSHHNLLLAVLWGIKGRGLPFVVKLGRVEEEWSSLSSWWLHFQKLSAPKLALLSPEVLKVQQSQTRHYYTCVCCLLITSALSRQEGEHQHGHLRVHFLQNRFMPTGDRGQGPRGSSAKRGGKMAPASHFSKSPGCLQCDGANSPLLRSE